MRLFHWSMVIVVFAAVVTGFLSPAWWLDIHVIAGYALSTLILFRILWGVLGSHYSQYKNFTLSPKSVIAHVRSLIDRTAGTFIGHNPVGAWVIVAVMVSLVVLVVSGLVGLGGQEKLGPLAFLMSYTIGNSAIGLHELFSWLLLLLVLTHFMGVVVEQRIFKHPVITSMVTGHVAVSTHQASANSAKPVTKHHTVFGTLLFIAIATVILFVGIGMANKPALGYVQLTLPETYASECGDCHDAYHPSLRSSATWDNILINLSDHFGEDASLDDDTISELSEFLSANGAEAFDTEVAHLVGRIETDSKRMTDTPAWERRHHDIEEDIFSQSNVGSKINCTACHSDAPTGRFDDSNIHIPLGNQK